MSHKITNRLPHLCYVAHSWVFMSVLFYDCLQNEMSEFRNDL